MAEKIEDCGGVAHREEMPPFEMRCAVDRLRAKMHEIVEDFRQAHGARNVEVILSAKGEETKCDVTIRY